MSGKLTLSAGGSKYWLLVADEATDMKFSFFMKKKLGHKRQIYSTLKGIAGHIQKEKYKVTMLGKTTSSKNNVLKKKWEYSLSIQPQEHHNKIQLWKRLFQPCLEK